MSKVYDWLRRLCYPLTLEMTAKMAIGRLTELDMIHILVQMEQFDQCRGKSIDPVV